MKKVVGWTTSFVFSITLFAFLLLLVQDGQSGEEWINYKGYYQLIIDVNGDQCDLKLIKKVAIDSGNQQHRLDYHIGAASNVSDATQPNNTHPNHATVEKITKAETETLVVIECEKEEEEDETSGNNDETSGNNDETSGNNDDSCSTCG